MIKLKDILAEVKLYAYSTAELLEKFLKFDGKTLVFFDTETVGLEPNTSYVQITHIAAMAYEGSSLKLLGELSKKVNLGDPLNRALTDPTSPEAKHLAKDRARRLIKYKKEDMHPSDILKMTGYYSEDAEKMDEKDALIEFESFLNKFENVILLAHNAKFDMKTIQARRKIHGLAPMKRFPVLDTVKIARLFFVPALIATENSPEAKKMLDGLLAKTKYKSYAVSLGKLASVLGVTMDKWHDAKADVQMLMEVLQKIIEFLKQNVDLDITKQKASQAKRYRNSPF
jgi:DNA polymerase III alpha subunit (gram-positive type)